jgi:hypothetical protein
MSYPQLENKRPGSMNGGEFLDQLSDYHLLGKILPDDINTFASKLRLFLSALKRF